MSELLSQDEIDSLVAQLFAEMSGGSEAEDSKEPEDPKDQEESKEQE